MADLCIKTAGGRVILIDAEDLPIANNGKSLFVKESNLVIISKRMSKTVVKHFFLHKLIMNCPEGLQVDHINGDRLDNRKINLRIVTNIQNQWNKANRSKRYPYKGIQGSFFSFYASIMVNWKTIKSRKCKTVLGAAVAHDELAMIHHGKFARLNFPFPCIPKK